MKKYNKRKINEGRVLLGVNEDGFGPEAVEGAATVAQMIEFGDLFENIIRNYLW